MDLDAPYGVDMDLYTIHSDAVARREGDLVFVLNRYLADNVLVLDASAGWSVVDQWSAGLDANPYDLEQVAPGRAYLTRYETTVLWVVRPTDGTVLGTVDLAAFADADGIPEMSQIATVGSSAFVSLQRLDRNQTFLPPAGGSCLVVLDTTSDAVVDADPQHPGIDPIDLPVENPSGDLWYDRRLNRLLVVCSGDFLALDGGLVQVNPFTLRAEGLVTTEAQLGGDLQAARLASSTVGWAVVSDASFRTSLVRFDVATGAVVQTALTTAGFDLSDLEISVDGRLYVGDRTPQAPGVRVFDALTGAPLAGPVDVGLPPFDLVLRDGSPTDGATAAPPARRIRLTAWPNPFNPRVRLRLEGAPRGEVVVVRDLRGRIVARLRPRADAEGWTYRWDGTDVDGREVAAGVYVARAGLGPSVKLDLVR
jgi:hypothetical protein